MKHLLLLTLSFLLLSLSAAANTPGRHSVDLSWTDPDATIVGYNVYRGTTAGVCTGSVTPYATSTSKAYTDTAVTAGTIYFYAVSAFNGAGAESACSAEVQAQIPSSTVFPTTPGAPLVTVH